MLTAELERTAERLADRDADASLFYSVHHGALWKFTRRNFIRLLNAIAARKAYNLETYGTCLTMGEGLHQTANMDPTLAGTLAKELELEGC